MTNQIDQYQIVTDGIVAAIEKGGTLPWLKPWDANATSKDTNGALPYNAASGRNYTGINTVILWGAAQAYSNMGFVTFNGARELGGTVRKGEKSCAYAVLLRDAIKRGEGDEADKSYKLMRGFPLWNVAQCDGLTLPKRRPIKPIDKNKRDATLDAYIKNTGASISYGGATAHYVPSVDQVGIPKFEHFKSASGFYATLFHELGHWTGHASRCDRSAGMVGRFGTEAYAMEELVAELTSAFLCAEHGVRGEQRHDSYIASWLRTLKNDKKAIFTAASKAQQAANYLNELFVPTEEEVSA